jgi:transposase
MDARVPLAKEILDRTPSEVLRLLSELFDRGERLEAENRELKARIERLETENRDLKAQLKLNSSNSSKPPSSDPPGNQPKRKPPEKPSGRSRGGQPGHAKKERPLVPPEEVNEFVSCKPSHCQGCGAPLKGDDPDFVRRQMAEIPPIKPDVTEYQVHTLTCPGCGACTTGAMPADAPRGGFGPRLAALVSLLSGAYRLGKRPIQQLLHDVCGLSISIGMICKLQRQTAEVLTPTYNELCADIRLHHVNVDETGWRGPASADSPATAPPDAESPTASDPAAVAPPATDEAPTTVAKKTKKKSWLWVVVAPMITVFRIASRRGSDVVKSLLGEAFAYVTTCDRWSAYRYLKRVQWCWAHLRRDFQAMIDRGEPSQAIGEALLEHSDALFHWWHRVRDGTLTRKTFQRYVGTMSGVFRRDLERGIACGCAKTAATCRDLLGHEEWLWTFVWHEGIEPTNNTAERTVRHAVMWRKTSSGTDSPGGSRFVERILSVVATCRQQHRNALDFLTECHRQALTGGKLPSLLPQPASARAAA